jgi:hypothetical protein
VNLIQTAAAAAAAVMVGSPAAVRVKRRKPHQMERAARAAKLQVQFAMASRREVPKPSQAAQLQAPGPA